MNLRIPVFTPRPFLPITLPKANGKDSNDDYISHFPCRNDTHRACQIPDAHESEYGGKIYTCEDDRSLKSNHLNKRYKHGYLKWRRTLPCFTIPLLFTVSYSKSRHIRLNALYRRHQLPQVSLRIPSIIQQVGERRNAIKTWEQPHDCYEKSNAVEYYFFG